MNWWNKDFSSRPVFRLNVLTLHLPALRKRREQILPLFDQFTQEIAVEFQRPVPVLDNGRVQILLSHDWPGNVRELKSAAKRFVLGFPLLGAEPMDARDPVTGLRMQMRVIEKMLIQDVETASTQCRRRASGARTAETYALPPHEGVGSCCIDRSNGWSPKSLCLGVM